MNEEEKFWITRRGLFIVLVILLVAFVLCGCFEGSVSLGLVVLVGLAALAAVILFNNHNPPVADKG